MQAPVAAIGMWCIPGALRPLGASLMTVAIHLLGDVPSPPLLGWLQTQLSEGKAPAEAAQEWRISMTCISLLLVCSGLVFLLTGLAATPACDFRLPAQHSCEAGSSEVGETDAAPLLEEGEGDSSSLSASPSEPLSQAP